MNFFLFRLDLLVTVPSHESSESWVFQHLINKESLDFLSELPRQNKKDQEPSKLFVTIRNSRKKKKRKQDKRNDQ